MKQTLLFLLLGVSAIGTAQITTSSSYTAEQLVNDVLINNTTISATNIVSSSGSDFGSTNSLGYFNQNGSSFPFPDGIILSTGDITTAPGPNTTVQSAGNWAGDAYLTGLMGQASANATSLQFDFVANSSMFSFDFIFASEEYGFYQCDFGDAFAIILTDLNTDDEINLALIPGTTIPVSVTSIRNAQYNSNCASANPEYFDAFYTSSDTGAPINFNGVTVPMQAQASLTPGTSYRLKIVIADREDPVFDSALFINGGSFNFDMPVVDLGTPEDIAVCDINSDGIATFDLTVNNTVILNGTNPSEYSINYFTTLLNAQDNVFSIQNPQEFVNETPFEQVIYTRVTNTITEFYDIAPFTVFANPIPVAGVTEPIVVLDNDMDLYTTVDLTTKEDEIVNGLSPSGFTIGYYTTEEDAAAAVNAIADAIAYDTTTGTIYFRLENNDTGCFTTGSFEVIVLPADYETPPPSGEAIQTFTEGETLANLELEGENIQWYASQSSDAGRSDNMPLPLTTPLADNTTYYASQTVYGIESSERFPVTANAIMGITDNAFAGLKIYPNPVQDVLAITGSEELTEISVYNVVGQMVYHINLNATTLNIDFSSLSKGIYVIKMLSGEKEAAMKVVKQ